MSSESGTIHQCAVRIRNFEHLQCGTVTVCSEITPQTIYIVLRTSMRLRYRKWWTTVSIFCNRRVKILKLSIPRLTGRSLYCARGILPLKTTEVSGYYSLWRSKVILVKKHLPFLAMEATPAPNSLNCGIKTWRTHDCEMGATVTKVGGATLLT